MTPDALTLERLRHLRLGPRHARPGLGPGERRSDRRGAGLEFIDHRPYRPGDDIRDLDHRLMARLGQPFLRRFASDERLPVTILLDTSASMAVAPGRQTIGTELAGLLGFVALAGGDALRLWRGGIRGAESSDLIAGVQRADLAFGWLARAATPQPMTYDALIAAAAPGLPPRGMVVLISDWQDAAALARLRHLVQAGHEPVVIRLSSQAEADPAALGRGVLVLQDAETGRNLTVDLTAEVLRRYSALWEAQTADLKAAAHAGQGHFFDFGLDRTAAELVLGPLRAAGLCLDRRASSATSADTGR